MRAGCYVAIIAGGFLLRKKQFLPKETFGVLSKIVVNITLPAAVIASTAGKPIDTSMLSISAMGIGAGIAYMLLALLLNCKKSREERAFAVLNTPGYNIGNFAMPFTQSFLGPMGVVATSLFDVGNSFISLGGALGGASAVKDGKGFRWKQILCAPLRTASFPVYVIMAVLNLLSLTPPEPIVELAGIVGSANPFLGMLMVGVGFRLSGDRRQLGTVARVLGLRFGLAAILAAVSWFVLPFPLEVRQALVLLVFSPLASAVPAFTDRLGGDAGLSSAINSFSILISIVCMVTLLMLIL